MATVTQTENRIAYLAELAASELLEAMPALKAAQPTDRSIAITQALLATEGNAATLRAVIGDDTSFGDLRDGWIQLRGGHGLVVQSHSIPGLLINSVIDGHSAKSVVTAAQAFANSRTSMTEWYTPLAGVTVTEAVSLCSDVDLIPWADVPDGDQKMKFGSDSSDRDWGLSMPSFPQNRATATSAIRVRSAECQVLFSSREDTNATNEASADESAARMAQTQNILRCITALSVHSVAALGGWARFDKKIANDIIGPGYLCNSVLFELAVYLASRKPVTLDGKSVAGLFQRFEKFEPAEKKVMCVALDRLDQALRRRNIVDKAIDLGIALEVMLLHGIGDNDRGELKYRSSIRGATFLGGDKSERLKTFKLLKDAYDLRSKAVHTGALDNIKKRPPPEQILEDATNTCASIARKLIGRRSFPDWESEYVIGGGNGGAF